MALRVALSSTPACVKRRRNHHYHVVRHAFSCIVRFRRRRLTPHWNSGPITTSNEGASARLTPPSRVRSHGRCGPFAIPNHSYARKNPTPASTASRTNAHARRRGPGVTPRHLAQNNAMVPDLFSAVPVQWAATVVTMIPRVDVCARWCSVCAHRCRR
ncbi:hypothetical protein PYCCODRAFT_1441180 [Trametes coccinea BRFM310]|uniref:Uncharacterized protein n=1 Tax=Trametes coccinea (strain BRFM310) TaxID=1353009 RepID=A0A1Y2I6I4_TRAC3|nr:hypothetical protein PYCCODRAFT_1441180 [Trametes coccinea BRFM310]